MYIMKASVIVGTKGGVDDPGDKSISGRREMNSPSWGWEGKFKHSCVLKKVSSTLKGMTCQLPAPLARLLIK